MGEWLKPEVCKTSLNRALVRIQPLPPLGDFMVYKLDTGVRLISFHVKECAEIFQRILGGVIVEAPIE